MPKKPEDDESSNPDPGGSGDSTAGAPDSATAKPAGDRAEEPAAGQQTPAEASPGAKSSTPGNPGSPGDIQPDQITHRCPIPDCAEESCLEDMVLHLTKHEDFFKDTSAPGRSKFSYLNGSYICSSCPFRTGYRMIFTEHVRHHVVLTPYSCRHCKLKVKGIQPLLKHHEEAHADKLAMLEIQTSKLLGNIMSKLGPQAPAADDVLTLSKSQVRPRPIRPQEAAPTGKTIVIDDDEEGDKSKEAGAPQPEGAAAAAAAALGIKIDSFMSIAGGSGGSDSKAHLASARGDADLSKLIPASEFRPGRNRPVKIQGLVECPAGRGDGKTTVEIFIKVPDENGMLQPTHVNFGVRGQFYVCLAGCNYETPSMEEFKSHMFTEIHCNLYKSIQKPCHSCHQQGVAGDRPMKPCPFVEELIKNIQKAKENAEKKITDSTDSGADGGAGSRQPKKEDSGMNGKEDSGMNGKESPKASNGKPETPTKQGESPMDVSEDSVTRSPNDGDTEDDADNEAGSDVSDTLPDLPTTVDPTAPNSPQSNDAVFIADNMAALNSSSSDAGSEGKKKRVAGRYAYTKGTYHCYSCDYQTPMHKSFRMHVWRHVHGKATVACEHCPESIKDNHFQFCYLINGVMTLVHRMADWCEERIKRGIPVTILENIVDDDGEADAGESEGEVNYKNTSPAATAKTNRKARKDAVSITKGSLFQAKNGSFDTEGNCSRFYPWTVSRKRTGNLDDLLKTVKEQNEKAQAHMQELAAKFVYKCAVANCQFSHPEVESFSIHNMLKHQNLTQLPCAVCSKNFTDIDGLVEHVEEHREESEIMRCMCLGCDYTCSLVPDLKKHCLAKHPRVQILKCCFCYKEWSDLSRYLWHIQEHIIREIKCPYCGITSADKNMIQQHMMDTHEDLPRKIVVNTQIINRLDTGEKGGGQKGHGNADDGVSDAAGRGREEAPASPHHRAELADTPAEPEPEPEIPIYKCSKCSYSACTAGSVNKHENIHGVEQDRTQRFLCPSCPHSFDNYHRLINHVQFHAGTSTVRFYHCSHCGFCTNVMSRIEDHLLGKHAEHAFKFEVSQEKVLFQEKMAHCPECRFPFIWPKDFVRHIPTHARCKPYIAPLKTKLLAEGSADPAAASDILKEVFAGYRSGMKKATVAGRKRSADGGYISSAASASVDEDPDSMSVMSEESENSIGGAHNIAIDKHHCDYCEFSTNHFSILQSHMNNKHPEHAGKFKEPAVTPRVKAAASKPPRTSPSRPSPTSTPEAARGSPSRGGEIRNTYLKGSFKCQHCPYTATNMKYMWRHQQQHKKVVQEGWKCPYCEYRTAIRKSGTFHLRRYHLDQPERLVPITGGVTAEEAAAAAAAAAGGEAQTPEQDHTSPYTTTQANTTVNPRAVRSIPETLVSLDTFELNLPEEMVFKSPIKCPKCPYSNKVKYNLVHHLKTHAEEEGGEEEGMDISDEESPEPNMGGGDSDGSPMDTDPGEDEGAGRSRAPKDHTEYCHKVQYMDLYQCNECVFMHRFPSKVLRHYNYRHAKLNPYKCGYCKFDSVESGKVIRHIHSQHAGNAIKVIKRTVARKANSPDQGDDMESAEPEEVVMSRERDDIEQEGEGQYDHQVIIQQLSQYIEKKDGNIQRCRFCSYEQRGASAIKRHVLSVHMKIYPWACKYCKMSSVEINKVKQHIAMTHPDQPMKVIQRNLTSIIGEEAGGDEAEDVKPDVDELNAAMGGFPGPLPADVKPEPEDDYGDGGGGGAAGAGGNQPSTSGTRPAQQPFAHGSQPQSGFSPGNSSNVGGRKAGPKMYHCAYCSYATKWNIRDVRTHIFHVHQLRKNFMCRYCKVGSKTKAQVLSHCAKYHPSVPLRVRDMRGALTNIMPVQEQDEVITVAVVDRAGLPMLEVERIRDPNFIASQSEARCGQGGEPAPVDLSVKRMPVRLMPKPVTIPPQSLGQTLESGMEPAKAPATGKPLNILWKCKLCGLSKKILAQLKYHQICYHLNLKPYSCPHCGQYFWKKTPVMRHIEADHPGMAAEVNSTMDEKIDFFKVNILKVIPSAEKKSKIVSNYGYETMVDADNVGGDMAEDEEPTGNEAGQAPAELFKCRHCNLLMVSLDAIKGHLEDNHPDDPPEFDSVRKGLVMSAAPRVIGEVGHAAANNAPDTLPEPPLIKRIKREPEDAAGPPPMPMLKVPELPKLKLGGIIRASPQLGLHKRGTREPSGGILYKCKHCSMATEGQTIIRHHVMVHLDYKPYSCPFCDTFRAVKSYPVKLHVQKTHHGCEVSVNHDPDGDMEEKIHTMYDKFLPPEAQKETLMIAERAATAAPPPPPKLALPKLGPIKIKLPIKFFKKTLAAVKKRDDDSAGEEESSPHPVVHPTIISHKPAVGTPVRRTVYKCMFRDCTYTTTQRPDVRRHLMREMRYKPYCCAYCDFREVNSGGLNKHFQRHPDKAPKIILRKNRAKEQRVEELIKQAAHVTFTPKKKLEVEAPLPPPPAVSFHLAAESSRYKLPSRPTAVTSPRPISPHKSLRSPLSPAFSTSSESHTASPVPKITNNPRQLMNQRASPGGAFSCPYDFCTFATYMRAKLSDHVMRHGPHKIQCGHCKARGFYPSELRKHHRSKHAQEGLTFKYFNLSPGPEDVPSLGGDVLVKQSPSSLLLETTPSPGPHVSDKSSVTSDDDAGFVTPPPVKKVGTTVRMRKATPENPMPVLDGLCLNIDLTPDRLGYYNCVNCEYRSKHRELFKKHVLIHEPPRLRCKFCKTKYRVMERLRRHSRIVHPGVEPEYEIIEPGDPDYMMEDAPVVKVKLEREDEYEDATVNGAPPPGGKKEVKITIQSSGGRYKVKGADSPTPSKPKPSGDGVGVQFCCHLCTFKSNNLMSFTAHLYDKHKMGESKPDKGDSEGDGEFQDDGSMQSSASPASESQLEEGQVAKPFFCNYCDYSAFQRFHVKQHSVRQHPAETVVVMERTPAKNRMGLKGRLSAYDPVCGVSDPHLDAFVKVEDILQIPQIDLEELLSRNGVMGIRL